MSTPALRFDDADLLSRLHTLRSYALAVKAQAEDAHLFLIAAHCAAGADEATEAITIYNQRTANEQTKRPG